LLLPLAEKGDAYGQLNLGIEYNHGRDATRDFGAATSWYRKAADQGDRRAQYNLGNVYDNGKASTAAA
jgi:uncharacterized protein